jgi:hypothetical protein
MAASFDRFRHDGHYRISHYPTSSTKVQSVATKFPARNLGIVELFGEDLPPDLIYLMSSARTTQITSFRGQVALLAPKMGSRRSQNQLRPELGS